MALYYNYFVEGDTEKKLLQVLKTDLSVIYPGKIQVFNVMQNDLNNAYIRMLKPQTNVVLVFDTDKTDSNTLCILKRNIAFLESKSCINKIICILQLHNLEDELMRCCRLNNICELTESRSRKDFKTDFIKCSNLAQRLKKKDFQFEKLWICEPDACFQFLHNDAHMIKKK